MGMTPRKKEYAYWTCDYCYVNKAIEVTNPDFGYGGPEDDPPEGWVTAHFKVAKNVFPDKAFCSFEHRRLYFLEILDKQKEDLAEYL